MTIRVVVVDDHTLVRQGIVGLLASQPDIDVVGQAGDAREAMAVIGKGRPTVNGWTVKADGRFDFSQPLRGDGDGSVLAQSAHPPRPIKATIVETTCEHTQMLRQEEVQTVIADFLR